MKKQVDVDILVKAYDELMNCMHRMDERSQRETFAGENNMLRTIGEIEAEFKRTDNWQDGCAEVEVQDPQIKSLAKQLAVTRMLLLISAIMIAVLLSGCGGGDVEEKPAQQPILRPVK